MLHSHSRPVVAMLLLSGFAIATPAVVAADLSELVGGKVAKVVGDCQFTEGPAWHPDGYLLFSDIPNTRIVRVNTDGSSSDWTTNSGGANGLMCDAAGNVYAAQGEAAQVAKLRTGKDGQAKLATVLAKQFDGKGFNRPNDLALDARGGLYFTDPNYGSDPPEQPVEGVYYISADGKVTRVIDDLPRPNGILVTQDGKSLLVSNINLREIVKYTIESPGKLSAGKVIFTGDEQADGNGPDGMTLDEHGNIYATYKTIVVIAPQGQLIGRIEIPEKPANCAFGGDDNRTLYVTARTSLYSLPMQVAGIALREPAGNAGADASRPAAEDKPPVEIAAVKAGEVTLQIPEAWASRTPTSNMRLAQFTLEPVAGDEEGAELVIYPPFGGSVAANIERWIGQFASEDRRLKMTQGTAEQGKYVLVDLAGTYNMPIGPPIRQQTEATPGYRMLAVVFSKSGGGNYFFKLTGPEKTVSSVADQFRKSFGGDASKERPYEF